MITLLNINKLNRLKRNSIIEHNLLLHVTKVKIDSFNKVYPTFTNDKKYRKTVYFDSYLEPILIETGESFIIEPCRYDFTEYEEYSDSISELVK